MYYEEKTKYECKKCGNTSYKMQLIEKEDGDKEYEVECCHCKDSYVIASFAHL